MKKSTKIVATIGPATESIETLEAMVKAGMNVARFNTKHSTPDWHNERIKRVKKVAQQLKTSVGVLVDLQGPEIRINLADEKPFTVKQGQEVTFTSDTKHTGNRVAYIPQEVVDSLEESAKILLDDGACEFIITGVTGSQLTAQALSKCEVKHRKTMNTPGTILDMPSITDRDRQYLDKINPKNIDFIGLSFVRNRNDIQILRQEMEQRQIEANIIAKIENQAALDNLDELIEASDGVMIARGDLGVEVDYQQLVYWQKQIISKCRDAAKPVITATQMLKSMVENPRPTRAEVSDVAHAIYDGTDAVMLSDETTIGKYPVQAVRIQAEIAEYNEQFTDHQMRWPANISPSLNITSNAANLLKHSQQTIHKIVCLTETGRTAQLLARFRPRIPIEVATHVQQTYQRLSLVYGVESSLIDFPNGIMENSDQLVERLKKKKIVKTGETILLIHGSIWKKPGLTNTLSLVTIN